MTPPTSRTLSCPHCRKPILDDGTFAGQVVRCPHCRGKLRIHAQQQPVTKPTFPVVEKATHTIESLRAVPHSEYMSLSLEERRDVFSVPGIESIETLVRIKSILADC